MVLKYLGNRRLLFWLPGGSHDHHHHKKEGIHKAWCRESLLFMENEGKRLLFINLQTKHRKPRHNSHPTPLALYSMAWKHKKNWNSIKMASIPFLHVFSSPLFPSICPILMDLPLFLGPHKFWTTQNRWPSKEKCLSNWDTGNSRVWDP